ncbi:hypothetical protein RRG08_030135 [Elysia crispata]|uniref:Uncharacterized protein n=1 Tax=Elysia crispata TaxID=231223 RepID=A0AAE0ZR42_9GAST|nr:hypothetical protein RRG08_030135 [Elysia crispata]
MLLKISQSRGAAVCRIALSMNSFFQPDKNYQACGLWTQPSLPTQHAPLVNMAEVSAVSGLPVVACIHPPRCLFAPGLQFSYLRAPRWLQG